MTKNVDSKAIASVLSGILSGRSTESIERALLDQGMSSAQARELLERGLAAKEEMHGEIDSMRSSQMSHPRGSAPPDGKYFEVPVSSADVMRCSDKECPCPGQARLDPGTTGYLYISDEVVDARRDALTHEALITRLKAIQEESEGPILFDVNPKFTCKLAAQRRGLDLIIAAADALNWSKTGSCPLRVSPLEKPSQDKPQKKPARLRDLKSLRRVLPSEHGQGHPQQAYNRWVLDRGGLQCLLCHSGGSGIQFRLKIHQVMELGSGEHAHQATAEIAKVEPMICTQCVEDEESSARQVQSRCLKLVIFIVLTPLVTFALTESTAFRTISCLALLLIPILIIYLPRASGILKGDLATHFLVPMFNRLAAKIRADQSTFMEGFSSPVPDVGDFHLGGVIVASHELVGPVGAFDSLLNDLQQAVVGPDKDTKSGTDYESLISTMQMLDLGPTQLARLISEEALYPYRSGASIQFMFWAVRRVRDLISEDGLAIDLDLDQAKEE